jgi:uncharacterized membrane protein YeaQ/YmgE (transglycosylase-associated protein family)
MELLFITLGGAILGLLARYLLPERHRHGSVLVPAIGAAVAAAVWEGFTWLGLKWNGGWIWVFTIVITAAVVVVIDLAIVAVRGRSDSALLATLSKGAATAGR